MKQEDKKETAMRRLSKALRKRFQGPSVNISWIELDAFMMKAQTWEMENILNSYNDGYLHGESGLPNKTQIEADESNTNV
jgi:hypothetical protein